MTEEKKSSLHESSTALCEVYKKLIEEGQVSFSLTQDGISKIDSIVKTVYANYFGFRRFSTPEDRAAAFFYLIIKDHPVVDGNKRLATLWLQIFCDACDLALDPKIPLDVLAVSVEAEKEPDVFQAVSLVKKILF